MTWRCSPWYSACSARCSALRTSYSWLRVQSHVGASAERLTASATFVDRCGIAGRSAGRTGHAMREWLLPVLVATFTTALTCTAVFSIQHVASQLSAWRQEPRDGRPSPDELDAAVLAELGTAGLMRPPEVRRD